MYVEKYRYSSPPTLWYRGGISPPVKEILTGPSDFSMSWRTGKSAVSSHIVPKAPTLQGKSLGQRLKERRDYYNVLQANVGSSQQGRPSSDRCFTADTGHDFLSVRFRGSPFTASSYGSGGNLISSHHGYPSGASVPSWMSTKNPSYSLGTSWAPGINFPPYPSATLNSMFGSTVPKGLQLGEFIIEIIRGDLPGLVTSLRRAATGIGKHRAVQRLRKADDPQLFSSLKAEFLDRGIKPKWLSAVGNDYLEFQFGMMPYVRLFIQAVTLLTQVTDALYGDSYRRVRRGGRVSDISLTYGRRDDRQYLGSAVVSGPLGYGGASGVNSSRFVRTDAFVLDHQLSFRATRAGQPTSGMQAIINKASSQLESLGLWYPSLSWDILPFSWLVDYVAHIGTAITNVSQFSKSGVSPLDYAYMTTKVVASTAVSYDSYSVRTSWGSTATIDNLNPSCVTKTTHRTQCTPFGVGLTGLKSLSTSQYAILVALGLAKRA